MKIHLTFLSSILLIQFNLINAQITKDTNNQDDTIPEKLFERYYLEKDTIFCTYYNSDTLFKNNNIFYVRHESVWVSFFDGGQISQKGDFKRWKRKMFFIAPVEHIRYLIKGYVVYNNKKYYPKVKVGKWEYFDKTGVLLKTEIYTREGNIILDQFLPPDIRSPWH